MSKPIVLLLSNKPLESFLFSTSTKFAFHTHIDSNYEYSCCLLDLDFSEENLQKQLFLLRKQLGPQRCIGLGDPTHSEAMELALRHSLEDVWPLKMTEDIFSRQIKSLQPKKMSQQLALLSRKNFLERFKNQHQLVQSYHEFFEWVSTEFNEKDLPKWMSTQTVLKEEVTEVSEFLHTQLEHHALTMAVVTEDVSVVGVLENALPSSVVIDHFKTFRQLKQLASTKVYHSLVTSTDDLVHEQGVVDQLSCNVIVFGSFKLFAVAFQWLQHPSLYTIPFVLTHPSFEPSLKQTLAKVFLEPLSNCFRQEWLGGVALPKRLKWLNALAKEKWLLCEGLKMSDVYLVFPELKQTHIPDEVTLPDKFVEDNLERFIGELFKSSKEQELFYFSFKNL